MVMEYTHGQMENYIKDYLKRAKLKAKDTSDLLMAQNIMDSTRMVTIMEMECGNRMANYSKSNMKMINSSAKLKCESSLTLTAK